MFLARVLPGAARAGCFLNRKRKKLTEANFINLKFNPKTKIKKGIINHQRGNGKKLTWANSFGRPHLGRKSEFQNYSCFLLDSMLKGKCGLFPLWRKNEFQKNSCFLSFIYVIIKMRAIYGPKILARPPIKIKRETANLQTVHKTENRCCFLKLMWRNYEFEIHSCFL